MVLALLVLHHPDANVQVAVESALADEGVVVKVQTLFPIIQAYAFHVVKYCPGSTYRVDLSVARKAPRMSSINCKNFC